MVWRIVEHRTIYRETGWYSAHPTVEQAPNGDLLVFFHRSPDIGNYHHAHPLFDLRSCRSRDGGQTWERPRLVTANPLGGVLDFGSHVLPDGSVFLYASTVALQPTEATAQSRSGTQWRSCGDVPFWVKSWDSGVTWSEPVRFPDLPDAVNGAPASATGVCRSGLVLLPDGRLLMPSKATDRPDGSQPYFGMMRCSRDLGETWEYAGRIAQDPVAHLSEPMVIHTPSGRLLALYRCHGVNPAYPDGGPYIALVSSDDSGDTWSPWRHTTLRGVNTHVLPLQDGRLFVTVGTRYPGTWGCTARVLEPEAGDLDTAPDFVVRGDSSHDDCSYPWSVELPDGRVFVVYYHTAPDGVRGIEGTILEEG